MSWRGWLRHVPDRIGRCPCRCRQVHDLSTLAGKLALIADAFETFHVQMVPSTQTGSPRERIVLLVRHVAELFVDSTFSLCIPALIEGQTATHDSVSSTTNIQPSVGRA